MNALSERIREKVLRLAREAGFRVDAGSLTFRITPPAMDYGVTDEVLRLISLARAEKGKEMAAEYDRWFGENTVGSSWIHEAAKEEPSDAK